MKRLLLIISICFAFAACERRELTYMYSPFCEVVLNIDWSNMTATPNGMTVMCYPESGEEPIIKVNGDNVNREVLTLPAGIYNIIVFNRQVSDFEFVGFRGMDKFETAEVHSVPTSINWVDTKAGEVLVTEPNEVAAATHLKIEITKDDISKSTAMYKSTGKMLVVETIDLKPVVVVKQAEVRVRVKGVYNLRSTRATLVGMADGYNFSTQKSTQTPVIHAMDQWEIVPYEYGEVFGETTTTFVSFGLPDYTTASRTDGVLDWDGSISLKMLLVDNQTIKEFNDLPIANATTTVDSGKLVTTIFINIDYVPELPDVKPEGGVESGFDAEIDPWGDDVTTEIPV